MVIHFNYTSVYVSSQTPRLASFIFQHLVCEIPLGSRKNTAVKIIGSPTSENMILGYSENIILGYSENMILGYSGAVESFQHVSELCFETF